MAGVIPSTKNAVERLPILTHITEALPLVLIYLNQAILYIKDNGMKQLIEIINSLFKPT